PADAQNLDHVFGSRFVYENADADNVIRQSFNDGARRLRRDVARAFRVEIEAQVFSAAINRRARVFERSDAADFQLDHHFSSPDRRPSRLQAARDRDLGDPAFASLRVDDVDLGATGFQRGGQRQVDLRWRFAPIGVLRDDVSLASLLDDHRVSARGKSGARYRHDPARWRTRRSIFATDDAAQHADQRGAADALFVHSDSELIRLAPVRIGHTHRRVTADDQILRQSDSDLRRRLLEDVGGRNNEAVSRPLFALLLDDDRVSALGKPAAGNGRDHARKEFVDLLFVNHIADERTVVADKIDALRLRFDAVPIRHVNKRLAG